MPPSRAWRRLLLVCFMLCTWGGQAMKEHQTLRAREAINPSPRPGPVSCRHQCHVPAKLFATHHLAQLALTSITRWGRHWFALFHRPVFF